MLFKSRVDNKPTRHFTPKKIVLFVFDLTATIVAAFTALFIVAMSLYGPLMHEFKGTWFWFPLVAAPVFYFIGFYDQMWVYASLPQYFLLGAGVLVQNFFVVLLMQLMHVRFPFVVYVLYVFLLALAISGIRIVYRVYAVAQRKHFSTRQRNHWSKDSKFSENKNKINVLVVGAGDAGNQVIKELKSKQVLRDPVAIVDDNPLTHTFKNFGVPVLGDRHMIPGIVEQYRIDEIIVAIPSATKSNMRDILNICNQVGVRVRTVPFLPQVLDGQINLGDIRDIDIEDLLGRDPVQLEMDQIALCIENKTVLVTGGGGTIGSELVRQIARFSPKQILIFDIYENCAYELQQDLRGKYGDRLKLKVLIGSVRDNERVREVFQKWRPDIVFHAAAHKHVPLMEDSPKDAVKNNIMGTYNVARAAGDFGSQRMVLISTDKAVNPTNVMGATKRFAEMVILAMNRRYSETTYAAVRFGNVLGSAGSVIPLFKQQIKNEHRVLVTDPEITRYFMTIPEAASLVMQAGALAKGGEIFVLDMGEPVKILDLAREVIRLSGFEPDVDIPIEFVGLRPGEKMYEELFLDKEQFNNTTHQKIFVLQQVHTRHLLEEESTFLRQLINCQMPELDSLNKELLDQICLERVE